MTKQAQNSIDLYLGQDPTTIKRALSIQKSSIINELKEHFGVTDIDTLAVTLANFVK